MLSVLLLDLTHLFLPFYTVEHGFYLELMPENAPF